MADNPSKSGPRSARMVTRPAKAGAARKTRLVKTARSKPDEQVTNKPRNDRLLIAGVLVLLLVFALVLLGTKLMNSKKAAADKIDYNGFKFEKSGSLWVTRLNYFNKASNLTQQYDIMFYYNPLEVKDVMMTPSEVNTSVAADIVSKRGIYITTEPDYPSSVIVAGVEISKILGQIYRKPLHSALTRQDPRTYVNSSAIPLITCANATEEIGVIYLKLGNTTDVQTKDNCVIIQGTSDTEVIRAADKVAFQLLKII